VRRAYKNVLHRPALRLALVEDARGACRNPRFVSFLAQSNRRTLDTPFQDAMVHGRKLMRRIAMISLIGGGTWIAIESIRALSVF
jgi:hypothetical protein